MTKHIVEEILFREHGLGQSKHTGPLEQQISPYPESSQGSLRARSQTLYSPLHII